MPAVERLGPCDAAGRELFSNPSEVTRRGAHATRRSLPFSNALRGNKLRPRISQAFFTPSPLRRQIGTCSEWNSWSTYYQECHNAGFSAISATRRREIDVSSSQYDGGAWPGPLAEPSFEHA